MLNKFLSIIFSVFFISLSDAQVKDTFPKDLPAFMIALKDYVNVSNREDVKKSFDKFEKLYQDGKITKEELFRIRDVSEQMMQKNMNGYPYFFKFFETLSALDESGNKEKHLFKWLLVADLYLKEIPRGAAKPFESFFDFSAKYFQYNTLGYIENGVNWGTEEMVSEIDFDQKKKVPVIKMPSTTLFGRTAKDTIEIENTSGEYYPIENIWYGNSGKVSWKRHDKPEVFVTFGKYTLEMQTGFYRIEEAELEHNKYFQGKRKGKFEDRLITGEAKLNFPKFYSSESIELKGIIAPNINYVGGFILEGTDFRGISPSEEVPSSMEFLNANNQIDMSVLAKSFVIQNDSIIYAKESKVSIYFDQDSIFHPFINIKYNMGTKTMTLIRENSGKGSSPFYDSYHMIDIKAKNIEYKSGSDTIFIGKPGLGIDQTSEIMELESFAYFNERDFRRLQNIDNINPISLIYQLTEREYTKELNADIIAKALNPKYEISSIRGTLFELEKMGFIYYDPEKEIVSVKDKLIHFAKAAPKRSEAARKREQEKGVYDYDVIKVKSNTKSTNGIIDLKNKNLYAEGVNGVILSDSQLVVMRPFEDKLIFEKNRNMAFDGRVYGGFCLFFGTEFEFLYDDFNVEMDSLQFLDFMLPTGDKDTEGNPILKPIATSMEDLRGILYIDQPNNKSSKVSYPEYPMFESLDNSYIFYDKKSIQKGAYSRDSFYFEAKPFLLDSLDNLNESSLAFGGTLNSAGIFPDFEENVTIQDDMSLGFVRPAPPEGFPMYGGQSKYKNEISLNNGGLTGSGTVEHLSVTMVADSILFLPQEMLAEAQQFYGERTADFGGVPKVSSENVFVEWKPYQDSMIVSSKETPHQIYNEDHKLTGNLIVQSTGMRGQGKLDWSDAVMKSDVMTFNQTGVDAASTYLGLKTLNKDVDEKGNIKMVMESDNVKAKVSFEDRTANFEANSADERTRLPYVEYETTMNQGNWDLNKQQLKFRDPKATIGQATALFISTHKDQDSLDFVGEFADYDLVNNSLIVSGVELIETADAYVYPPDGIVEIGVNANMQTFQNAKILCSTTNKNHEIVKATVDINGHYDYTASGYYVYDVGDKKQEIEFSNITVGRDRTLGETKKDQVFTQANGAVGSNGLFYIDEKVTYEGDVFLKASTKNLTFKGFAKIQNDNISKKNDYFFIDSPIDRKDVSISYDTPVNKEKEKVYVGLRHKDLSIYPLFMQKPKTRSDHQFFTARGLMKYDNINDEFKFGDSLRVIGKSMRGNLVTLNNSTLDVLYEGDHRFFKEVDYLDIKFIGRGNRKVTDSAYVFKSVASFDFKLPAKILDIINEDFYSLGFALKDTKIPSDIAEIAMHGIMPDSASAVASYNMIKNLGSFELPKKWYRDLIMCNMDYKWSADFGSFVLENKKVGITHIGEKNINKEVKAYSEIRIGDTQTKEQLTLYIELSDNIFYYFNLTSAGKLQLYSSNSNFMEAVEKMKKSDANIKIENNEYSIMPAVVQDADFFRSRMLSGGNMTPGSPVGPAGGSEDDFFDFEEGGAPTTPINSDPNSQPIAEPVEDGRIPESNDAEFYDFNDGKAPPAPTPKTEAAPAPAPAPITPSDDSDF